jgi:hypothetical protein
MGNPFPARLFPKPPTVSVTLWTTGTQGEKINRVWHTLWNYWWIYRFAWPVSMWWRFNSSHASKPFLLPSIVCMPKGSSQMAHFTWGGLQRPIIFLCWQTNNSEGSASVSISIFSCLIRTGDQLQEDLVRSGYKTNKEVKILAILLHVGEPIEPTK